VALGGEPGELPLNVMQESAFTSFLAPDPSAVPTLARSNSVVQVEMVPVRRLDEMMNEVRSGSACHSIYLISSSTPRATTSR
jgi:hypothetical protein